MRIPLVKVKDILVSVGLASSKGEARRLIEQKGVRYWWKEKEYPFPSADWGFPILPGVIYQRGPNERKNHHVLLGTKKAKGGVRIVYVPALKPRWAKIGGGGSIRASQQEPK